jgi:hypothetical protein
MSAGQEVAGAGPLTDEDVRALATARARLENPGLAMRLSSLLGTPIEKGMAVLPASVSDGMQGIAEKALLAAMDMALRTLDDSPGRASRERWHTLGVTMSGGVGGFFGTSALLAELPVSTTIMLRSIADVARSEGESLADARTRLACLEVFALGGDSASDDAAEAGYYVVRSMLAGTLRDAAEHVARHGFSSSAGPALVRFVARVAQYFGVQLSQKLAAQALPAIGAVGGATVNALFIDHYQSMARGHFAIRRLERAHGQDAVRRAYLALAADAAP